MDAEKQDKFVLELALTGSIRAAARAAAGPGREDVDRPDKTSWHRLRKTDPEFDRRCRNAIDSAVARAEKTLYELAVVGVEEPILGTTHTRIVGHRRVRDTKLLMRFLARHDKAWLERQELAVEEIDKELPHRFYIKDQEIAELSTRPEFADVLKLLRHVEELRAKGTEGESALGMADDGGR